VVVWAFPFGHTVAAEEFVDPPKTLVNLGGILGIHAGLAAPDTLQITSVRFLSPAARCGLQPGDQLVAVAPYRVRTLATLVHVVQSHAPGTTVDLRIVRNGVAHDISCNLGTLGDLSPLMSEGSTPDRPLNQRLKLVKDQPGHFVQLVQTELTAHQAQDAALKLENAFKRETDRFGRSTRLENVNFALRHPFKSAQLARQIATTFDQPRHLGQYLIAAAAHLDLAIPMPTAPASASDLNERALLNHLLAVLENAGKQIQGAFTPLTSDQQDTLLTQAPALLEQFSDHFMLDKPVHTAMNNIHTLRLAKRVDLTALFNGALHLASLTTPSSLKQMHRLAVQLDIVPTPDGLPADFTGDFLLAHESPWGWILVGARGPNYYGAPTALVIDLGGDDIYTLPSNPSSVHRLAPGLIIDYSGNDRYISHALGGFAGALGGIRFLVDLKGNDLYQGSRISQGAAFCGIGVLWDQSGNDIYLAQELTQGAAIFGFGALLDQQGNDLFSAAQFAQGFGATQGFGLLADSKGDDRYLAGGKAPSTYGTLGVFRGWSQGVGCGFRGFTAGGIGLLLDGAGDDSYQAGNFSQGTGYFFGMGILADHRGNDQYIGSRYAQGAAAHQAVGVLLEDSGNDRYQSKIAAAQGSGWDAAIGILWDRRGDDRYQGGDLSQGAASMNGLGILVDQAGHDTYTTATSQAQGYGGSTDYYGGRQAPNLGILLDAAGNDRYLNDNHFLETRQNKHRLKTPGVGLFSDH
jgi:hypothetical protein